MRRLCWLCSKPPWPFIRRARTVSPLWPNGEWPRSCASAMVSAKISVQFQRAGDVARDGGDFNRVREPRAQMVAGAVEKNLRLVFQPAEGARMDDAVAVALVMRAPFRRGLLVFASARVAAELRVGRENLAFDLFQFLTGARHGENSGRIISSPAVPARKCRAAQTAGGWCPRSSCSGSDAPAVMPTVMLPDGSQSCVSTSLCRCWL